jgi:hypothetical protein
VRAFNESIYQSISRRGPNLPEITDELITRHFPTSGLQIVTARDEIIQRIEEFMKSWVTIYRDGPFQKALDASFQELMTRHWAVSKDVDSTTPKQLGNFILDDYRHRASDLMLSIQRTFVETYANHIRHVLGNLRSYIKSPDTSVFLDALENHTSSAITDVSNWLGLWTTSVQGIDFYINELIQFEATTLILSDYRKLRIKYVSYIRRNGQLIRVADLGQIKGVYIEGFFEIIHNLLSTAYKHSGLDVNTPIELSVTSEPTSLTIACVNVFHERMRTVIEQTYPTILKSIRAHVSRDPHVEGLLGFKKIKIVSSRVFKSPVKINVPPPSLRNLSFRVEVEITNLSSRLFVQ